jgi:outer membrane protein insertion porin family
MKRIIVLVLSVLSVCGVFAQNQNEVELNYYSPSTYLINKITVTGTSTLNDAILSMSGLVEGDEIKIPGDQITRALKNIWAQNIVDDVVISISKVEGVRLDLNIHIHELPRIDRFDIIGEIKKSERKDLLEQINVVRGQRFTASLEKNTKNIIEKYLQNKGYYFARAVPFDTMFNDENLKNVTFKVKKGRKVKIKEISIVGNEEVDYKTFNKQMHNTKAVMGIRVWKRSKYIPSDFSDDKDAVKYYYNSLGLRDFKINSSKVVQLKNKRFINIKFDVTEGRKYYFGKINWIGNYKYTDAILDSILDIKEGDVFNQQLLDTKLNFNPKGLDVSSLYLDNGYLFFNVTPTEVSIRDSVIDLEMKLYEGAQATYSKIVVKGNTKTNDHVILREIRTMPGDKFSRSDLIRTQRELAQLGYFDAEQIGINPKPNPSTGTVDIEYTLVEKPNDQLQLSGGWGGATGFVGTVGLAFNNFSLRNVTKTKTWDPLPAGDGQRLSLRFQANFNYFSYSFSFTEPWLGGRKPNSLTLGYSHSKSKRQNAVGPDGFLKIDAVTLSLGRRLKWPDNWFTLINSLSLTQYDVDNYQVSGNACSDCKTNNFKFITTLARNNIGTNPNYPTSGGNMAVSLALTPPYSLFNDGEALNEGDIQWIEYHKWMFDFSQYMQLTNLEKDKSSMFSQAKKKRSFVLVTRAHFGFIGSYTQDLEPSEYERFEMGGSGLSGYNSSFLLGTDIIGLRGYKDGSVRTSDGGNGLAFSKYVMELRYPVITEGIATIYILGFLEGGNNFATVEEFNPFNIRRSAGFGARIFMPAFGLIGIDYGKGFDPIPGLPNANEGQFHFTIGKQLR